MKKVFECVHVYVIVLLQCNFIVFNTNTILGDFSFITVIIFLWTLWMLRAQIKKV